MTFDPNEPRVPAGNPGGGEWVKNSSSPTGYHHRDTGEVGVGPGDGSKKTYVQLGKKIYQVAGPKDKNGMYPLRGAWEGAQDYDLAMINEANLLKSVVDEPQKKAVKPRRVLKVKLDEKELDYLKSIEEEYDSIVEDEKDLPEEDREQHVTKQEYFALHFEQQLERSIIRAQPDYKRWLVQLAKKAVSAFKNRGTDERAFSLTRQQLALWAAEVTRDCLLAAGDDAEAGLAAAEYVLATHPIPKVLSTNQKVDILFSSASSTPITEAEYPRNRANQFLDKYDIACAARDPEEYVALRESLPEQHKLKLDRMVERLLSGGAVHHPREHPGLGINADGEMPDESWSAHVAALEEYGEWIDRHDDRERRCGEVEDFTEELRRTKTVEVLVQLGPPPGATDAEVRAVERLVHQIERRPESESDRDDQKSFDRLLNLYEDTVEAVHRRIEAECEADPEPDEPEEPTSTSVALGMVGDEWHGPKPPGNVKDWVPLKPGPRGGKRWKRNAGVTPYQTRAQAKAARPKPQEVTTYVQTLLSKGTETTAEDVKNLSDTLMKMTVDEIQQVKKSLNLKASGTKAELAAKIASRALQKVRGEKIETGEVQQQEVKQEIQKQEVPEKKIAEKKVIKKKDESTDLTAMDDNYLRFHISEIESKIDAAGHKKYNRKQSEEFKRQQTEAYTELNRRKKIEEAKKEADFEKEIGPLRASAGPPSPVQKHGMSSPEDMQRVTIDKTHVYYAKECEKQALTFAANLKSGRYVIPPTLVAATKTVIFSTQKNEADDRWAEQYNMPGFTSLATGGGGNVVVYNGHNVGPETFAHESGHNLATKLWGFTLPLPSSEYGQAQQSEPPVTSYGSKSGSEDFAEACAMWVTDRNRLQTQFPKKFAALEKLLS